MENASKALIIAGAILLAILIISLGMMVLNNATGFLKNGGMDDAAVMQFNSKFLKYEGSQKGSQIRTMVGEVMANNNNSEASDETRVNITGVVTLDADEGAQPNYGQMRNTTTYTVTVTYRDNGTVQTLEVH